MRKSGAEPLGLFAYLLRSRSWPWLVGLAAAFGCTQQGAPQTAPLSAAGTVAVQAGVTAFAGANDGDEWPADCEERYLLRAHAQPEPGDATPYVVPANTQYYASFMFRPPWGDRDVQGLAFRSRIDNPAIVHHWILYGADDAVVADGAVHGEPGQRFPTSLPEEAFIQGWAPGGDDLVLPDQVGLHMPRGPNAALRLELHYSNYLPSDERDASGVELCVTTRKRPEVAAVHWLGTPLFSVPAHSRRDVVSECRPKITAGPVHLIQVAPHMHTIGVGAKAVIHRADGRQETLLDGPFDFNDQRSYRTPSDGSAPDVLLHSGDTITTTCQYDNQTNAAISFGAKTEDEMCFFFVLAWPRGQLTHGQYSLIPGADPAINCLR
ncbi:MAG: hypothetical protein ABW321_31110 [Polyangiales bacterium]